MASADRLVIFKGDDTGGTFGRRISFTITAGEGVSLDGCRAEWVFDGIVKEFSAPIVSGEEREIFYSHNETRCMKPGVRFGTFRIIDAAGKVRTFDNTRPVEVTDSVARCYPGSSSATIFVGTTVTWEQVSGKPLLVKTINGEPPDANGNIEVASGGTVKSATVNGGTKVTPTTDGNLALTVGISDIPGLSDFDGRISEAASLASEAKGQIYEHEGDTDNPHETTAEQVGAYTKEAVDEKINEFAAHYLTADALGNAFATATALKEATAFYYAGELHTPDKNDYCIVRADEDHRTSAGIAPTTRYFYVGDTPGEGEWVYAYTINETSLTQAQIDALDSGITSAKVAEFDAKQDALTDAQLANIDAVPQKRDKTDMFTQWVFGGGAVAKRGLTVGWATGYWYMYLDGVEVASVYDSESSPSDLHIEFTTYDQGVFSSAPTATRKKIATEDQIPSDARITELAGDATKVMLPYATNSTGLKDRSFNALSFDGTEYDLSTALAAVTPTAEGQPRDLLIVATATAATTISYTAGTIKGDKPTIDGAGTWLITLTEYAANTWYCRQIKMEDAA